MIQMIGKTSYPPGSSSHVSHAPGTFQGPKLASKSPDTSHRFEHRRGKAVSANFPRLFCVLPKNMGRTKSCIIEYLDTFIITYKSYRKIFHCLMGYDVTFWMRSRDAKTSQPSRPGMKSLGSSMLGRHWNPLLFLNIFYKYIIYLYVYIDI